MKLSFALLFLSLSRPLSFALDACADDGYSMYVWTMGFNPTAPHCNGVYPINKDGDNATCFTHNWDTLTARQAIWASCTQPGREVTRLFVSDMKSRIENDGYNASGSCDSDVMALLSEAHQLGIRVYALFAVSDEDFSESYMASYPGQFNANCGDDVSYFDGVAVNNEYFSNINDCDDAANIPLQQDHLDKLQLAVDNAGAYSLPLHFSLSWNWDDCSITWPAIDGTTKSVMGHMIDIVDSVDIQVAYIKNSTMVSRSAAAYGYWDSKPGKLTTSRIYVLSYTNPNTLCQTSYSPHIKGSSVAEDSCAFTTNPRTEAGMHMGFDYVEGNHPLMKGSIHFMNGVYGSGITFGWPEHTMPFPHPYCTTKAPTTPPTNKPTFQSCTIAPAKIVKLESHSGDPIHIFEVRAISSGNNVANRGIATQSSTYKGLDKFAAHRANDLNSSTFSHTNSDAAAWWQVDLGQAMEIESVQILNRWCKEVNDPTKCLCRLSDANLTLHDEHGLVIASQPLGNTCGKGLLNFNICGSSNSTDLPRVSTLKLQSLTDAPIQVFEVEVYSSGENIALGKTASQSSTLKAFDAIRAIDGSNESFSHTDKDTCSSWWKVDLGELYALQSIRILNRYCGDVSDQNRCLCRLSHAAFSLFDDKGVLVDTILIDDMCGRLEWEHNFTSA